MSAATGQSIAVGIQAMDDQHEILIDTLNELRQQLSRGNASARLSQQMARLVEFAGMHFDCEERLLRRHGYPNAEEHSTAHQDLLDKIRYAVDRADRGDDAELQRSFGFLRSRLMDHVSTFDRQYAEWLNARGVY
jgi:hemerythrin